MFFPLALCESDMCNSCNSVLIFSCRQTRVHHCLCSASSGTNDSNMLRSERGLSQNDASCPGLPSLSGLDSLCIILCDSLMNRILKSCFLFVCGSATPLCGKLATGRRNVHIHTLIAEAI